MKVSVSLPGEDIRFLDQYARQRGLESRSAAVHRAIRLLQASELSADYERAWDEWAAGAETMPWESTVGDGLRSNASG
jgi:Arc/MetJ-type ribon-helix-helix transcriptional regulator